MSVQTPALNAAVVLVLSPTGLSVARSLAPREVQVWGVDANRLEIGHFSRFVRRDRRFCYLPPGEKLIDALLAFGARQAIKPVLFIAGDPYIDVVSEHHQALRERFILPDSMRPEINSLFVNKQTFYTRCRELNVDLPMTFFPQTESQAQSAASEIRYPAIVKPALGHLFRTRLKGQKLAEVYSPEELMRWWRQFRQWGGESVIQEVVVGPEANIFVAGVYMDARLHCRSIYVARKCRQSPPWYGSASYIEAEWQPTIARLSIDVLRKLGYRGICGVEYKLDPRDGRFKLIEINTRPTLYYAATRAAGVDVVWDAYCDLIGRPQPHHVNCQDNGMRWQFLARDLVSSMYFLRQGALSWREFWRTTIDPRRKEDAVLAGNDLGTLLAYPLYNVAKLLHVKRGGDGQAVAPPAPRNQALLAPPPGVYISESAPVRPAARVS